MTLKKAPSHRILIGVAPISDENQPIHQRLNRVSEFTSDVIEAYSVDSLSPGSIVFSSGLACFRAVAAACRDHVPVVICGRGPKDVLLFQWLNIIIRNVKTALYGTHHALTSKSIEITISLRCLIASTEGGRHPFRPVLR